MCNVVLTDLRKFGVAVPAGLAVVSRPVRVGGHFAKAAPGTAQQEYAVVSGAQLQVVKSLAEDVSFDGLAFRGLNLQLLTARRTGCGAMLNRTQKIQQLRHFRTWDAAWRHASCGQRSEEHTSELQSPMYLVCRLLLEKKKKPSEFSKTSARRRPNG